MSFGQGSVQLMPTWSRTITITTIRKKVMFLSGTHASIIGMREREVGKLEKKIGKHFIMVMMVAAKISSL